MERTTALVLPKWKIWLLASRPKTLVIGASPVFIGTLFSKTFDPLTFFFTLFAALAIQIGTNLANDYFDYFKGADTEERKGPPRVTQNGLLSPKAVKWGFVAVFALSAICSLFLIAKGGGIIGLIAALSILLGMVYTAGPYPIAYLGFGELFVFVFFGLIATGATAYLQTGHWSPMAVLAGVGPGSLACCVLTMNNLRDRVQDKKANKKTSVVRFGLRYGKWQYTTFLSLALFSPLFFWREHPAVCLTTLLLFFPSFFVARSLFKPRVSYESLFKITPLLLVCYTLFFILGWFI